MRYTLNSEINVTTTSFYVLRSVIFMEMRATNFLVLRALFALMVGGFSFFGIGRILTSTLQIWRECDSRYSWGLVSFAEETLSTFMFSTFSLHIAGSVLKRAIAWDRV